MTSSIYLKNEMTIKDLEQCFPNDPRINMGQKWWFVGIDLAPTDTLESGVVALDRTRSLMRMDKFTEDDEILAFLKNLSCSENILVVMDIPKSLSIQSKWRQQELKMHPLSIRNSEKSATVPTERYCDRAQNFYAELEKLGILTFGFFTPHAKLRYNLNIPYRHRSSLGCRALQSSVKQCLGIQNIPSNLVASSVLDAMIAAYTAWLCCYGKEEKHFKLYSDNEKRLYIDPLAVLASPTKSRRGRTYQ
jgi:hypothetical protein